jgi:hypothetical protein
VSARVIHNSPFTSLLTYDENACSKLPLHYQDYVNTRSPLTICTICNSSDVRLKICLPSSHCLMQTAISSVIKQAAAATAANATTTAAAAKAYMSPRAGGTQTLEAQQQSTPMPSANASAQGVYTSWLAYLKHTSILLLLTLKRETLICYSTAYTCILCYCSACRTSRSPGSNFQRS